MAILKVKIRCVFLAKAPQCPKLGKLSHLHVISDVLKQVQLSRNYMKMSMVNAAASSLEYVDSSMLKEDRPYPVDSCTGLNNPLLHPLKLLPMIFRQQSHSLIVLSRKYEEVAWDNRTQ